MSLVPGLVDFGEVIEDLTACLQAVALMQA